MCGIVGIVGSDPVSRPVVEALRRLEYRGYDSAGIATLESGRLDRRRAAGKLLNLELRLVERPLRGPIGIGHTRWATHGRPSEANAHPHATGRVAVVHNGIVENFRALRAELEGEGVAFETETDTEVVARLVSRGIDAGQDPVAAVEAGVRRLRGAYALCFLFDGQADFLVGVRRGAPLAVGLGGGAGYLGSDASALAGLADAVAYLEEGDLAVVGRDRTEIRDADGRPATRTGRPIPREAALAGKGGYRHFMAKEIHEQPEVVGRTVARYVDPRRRRVRLPATLPFDLRETDRLTIAGCGTAHYAGLVARYWFEALAGLDVDVDVASEARYRAAGPRPRGATLVVSQSGETADTLAALRVARAAGRRVLAVVNVPDSSIAREASAVLPTLAGPEIGVASTKAFTCQLAALLCLAVAAGRARGTLDAAREAELVEALLALPRLISGALALEPRVAALARPLSRARDVLFLGRGTSHPLALEGALKLKETSYLHAEGHAAGELKHGPIALVDPDVPTVVIAPRDPLFEKTLSNLHEVAARGGPIALLCAPGAGAGTETLATLELPETPPELAPIVYAVPLQLLAYHVAALLGKDVDQPRNLAKSVTVE